MFLNFSWAIFRFFAALRGIWLLSDRKGFHAKGAKEMRKGRKEAEEKPKINFRKDER